VNEPEFRRWFKRIAIGAVFGASFWTVLRVFDTPANLPALIAGGIVIAVCTGYVRDVREGWSITNNLHTRDESYEPSTRNEGRLFTLHNICSDVTAKTHRVGHADRNLQRSLRTVVEHRINPSGAQFVSSKELPQELRAYLESDPPPRLTLADLNAIVDRIEQL